MFIFSHIHHTHFREMHAKKGSHCFHFFFNHFLTLKLSFLVGSSSLSLFFCKFRLILNVTFAWKDFLWSKQCCIWDCHRCNLHKEEAYKQSFNTIRLWCLITWLSIVGITTSSIAMAGTFAWIDMSSITWNILKKHEFQQQQQYLKSGHHCVRQDWETIQVLVWSGSEKEHPTSGIVSWIACSPN